MNALSTGQLARQAEVGLETIRYYERRGLLAKPVRKPSGYRQYAEDAVRRLRFIKRAQQLGFTLNEIKELVALWEDPEADRSQVRQRALAKVADVEARIRDLEEVKTRLLYLSKTCHGQGSAKQCPIMLALAE